MSRSRLLWRRNVVLLAMLALAISPAAAQQDEPTKLYETFKTGLDSSLVENDPKDRYVDLREAQDALGSIERDFPNSAEAVMVSLGDTGEVFEALSRTRDELMERLLSFLDEHPISAEEGIGGVRPGQTISALSSLGALLPRSDDFNRDDGTRTVGFDFLIAGFYVEASRTNKGLISSVTVLAREWAYRTDSRIEGIRAKLRALPMFAKKLSLFLTYDEVIAVLGPPTSERLGDCQLGAGKANRFLYYPQLSLRVCKVVLQITIDR